MTFAARFAKTSRLKTQSVRDGCKLFGRLQIWRMKYGYGLNPRIICTIDFLRRHRCKKKNVANSAIPKKSVASKPSAHVRVCATSNNPRVEKNAACIAAHFVDSI